MAQTATPPAAKLSTLDFAFSAMATKRAPLDFAFIFHLTGSPGIDAFRAGARSARIRYPTTGSYIDQNRWLRGTEPSDEIELAPTPFSETQVLRDFVSRPWNLRKEMPVRQLLISSSNGGSKLVTRFHHAAADGMSAAMWLGHQLRVAHGLEEAATQPALDRVPLLRTSAESVRRSKFAYAGASDQLWTSNQKVSGGRQWFTIDFHATDLRRGCRKAGGFTYSDLLATCALEVFAKWNRIHRVNNGQEDKQRIGLWLPMNVRKQSTSGFGNGSSRVRLYARYPTTASLTEKSREIRRQVAWSSQFGEWVVPQARALTSLPQWIAGPLLRSYLRRPSVDMATGVFSHAERWDTGNREVFANVEQIECIGLLHPRQCIAINGVTHQQRTMLTFTYDPGRLHSDDVQQLADLYQQQIALARSELL